MVDAFAVWTIPTSGPQLVYQKGCCVCCPVFAKVHIKDPLLVKSSLYRDSWFPLKKYVTMTTISNSRLYENHCALEALLNKTNFPFLHLWEIRLPPP